MASYGSGDGIGRAASKPGPPRRRTEDARRPLEDCLRDEPGWRGLLRVEAIEFAGMLQSAN